MDPLVRLTTFLVAKVSELVNFMELDANVFVLCCCLWIK